MSPLNTAMEWSCAPVPAAVDGLRRAGIPEPLAPLLARRGLEDPAAAARFLSPQLDQLHEPTLLAGLGAAVERLVRARRSGEIVTLVGDYDVDGVTGTALLAAVLRACKLEVRTILPHRMHDGYGFQPVHVERAAALGSTLVVTVDCGSNSQPAVEAARRAGLDVIVTDHHLPEAELPAEVVHVNPRQPRCDYPFADLSGAGLAFKLGAELARVCEYPADPRALLRIACLGTIADMVPLRGENRVIAAIGLAELGHSRSAGLRALIARAGVRPPLRAADVGFRLGPMLNAPGRLDHADKALELLLSRDARQAAGLAAELDGWNRERQDEERRVAEQARALVLARQPLPPFLIAWSEHWHRGVVGIAAGRLARELHRPVVLLALEGETATGSGRSVPQIHLHGFLAAWCAELERFGGHAQAVGLSVARSRLERLRGEWEEAAAGWAEALERRSREYELEIGAEDVGEELLAALERLEPFGEGNPEPLVRVRGPLRLAAPPRIFGRGHISAEARAPNGARMRLLGWGWGERTRALEGEIEVFGYLERDRFRGGTVLRLLDSRRTES